MTKLLFTSALLLLISHVSFGQNPTTQKGELIDSVQQLVVAKEVPADLSVITPPVGFDTSTYFTGYIHFKHSAAIIIHEIENAYFTKIEAGITEDYFETNKLTLIEKKSFVSDHSAQGIYYKSRFLNKDVPYIRFMVYSGTATNLLILDIVYPESKVEFVERDIIASFSSINFKR